MPFTVGWYDTGMLVDCTDSLDAEAAEKLLKVVVSALNQCASPTNIILDWRGSRGDAAQRRRCIRRIASLDHPKRGMVAAVENEPTASLRVDRLYGGRAFPCLACASLEEAISRLRLSAAAIH